MSEAEDPTTEDGVNHTEDTPLRGEGDDEYAAGEGRIPADEGVDQLTETNPEQQPGIPDEPMSPAEGGD